jgi:hypothetical protein
MILDSTVTRSVLTTAGLGAIILAFQINGYNFDSRAENPFTTTPALTTIATSTRAVITPGVTSSSVNQTSLSAMPRFTGFPPGANPFRPATQRPELSTAAAIGIGSGSVIALIGLVAFVTFCFLKRRKRRARGFRRRQVTNEKESLGNPEYGEKSLTINKNSVLVRERDGGQTKEPLEMLTEAEARELSSQTPPLELDSGIPAVKERLIQTNQTTQE